MSTDKNNQAGKRPRLEDWALRGRKKPFITPDHPQADLFFRVLGAGLCTKSSSNQGK